MADSATLTKTGQITIPKWVREILGVTTGERIVFRRAKDGINIEREKSAAEIAEKIDQLIPEDARKHHMKYCAGLTPSEAREKWANSEDGRKYFEEEFERCR